MKILYTTHQFYPDYGAGTELLTYMTASQMRDNGHIVKIATGYPSKNPPEPDHAFDEYLFDNLTVNRYRHSSFHPVRNQCIMAAEHHNRIVKKWFKKILVEFQPDLVHVFHLQRLSASILEICYELGIPFIITVTDFWMICPTTQLLLPDNSLCTGPQKMMENCIKHLTAKTSNPAASLTVSKLPDCLIRGILHLLSRKPQLRVGPLANVHALTERPFYLMKQINRANRIFVTNQFMQSILEKHGVRSDIIRKMPFGIRSLEKISVRARKEKNVLRIGFIGTLNFHKGAHILIKAACALSRSKTFQIKIFGKRQQFPDYVTMLDDLADADPRIEFKGTFPPDKIGCVLSEIDVLVVPSLWYENTPLILHQAQAAKVPVIATDLGGMNEIVENGVNGYLIQPGNDNELSAIIEFLLKDPRQLEVLRQQIKAPLFIDQYADKLETQYREIGTIRSGN